jgi:sigma-B regulation protein RsbU (phosphoserine phosphatase)
MEQQNQLYFTIWYGVYDKITRTIRYGGGGHPPAILLTGPTRDQAELQLLEARGPMVGAIPDLDYSAATCQVGEYSRLFLFSDGAYEVERSDGKMWPFSEFITFMGRPPTPGVSEMDALVTHVRELSGKDEFADDFSIIEFRFDA